MELEKKELEVESARLAQRFVPYHVGLYLLCLLSCNVCVTVVCHNTRAEEQTKNYRCAAEEKLAVKKASKAHLGRLRRAETRAKNLARKQESVLDLKKQLAAVELVKKDLEVESAREARRL